MELMLFIKNNTSLSLEELFDLSEIEAFDFWKIIRWVLKID